MLERRTNFWKKLYNNWHDTGSRRSAKLETFVTRIDQRFQLNPIYLWLWRSKKYLLIIKTIYRHLKNLCLKFYWAVRWHTHLCCRTSVHVCLDHFSFNICTWLQNKAVRSI
jgi:hypothetical protein